MIEEYLKIIWAKLVAEYIETSDKALITEIVLRAGGSINGVEKILGHPAIDKIGNDRFSFKKFNS